MSLPDEVPAAPAAAGWEQIVGAIGPKVRQARQQLGLSLQQLSARAEVSAAAIHKVERGEMVPTITTLLKLTGALGRPLAHFVDDAAVGPVAVHRRAEEQPAPPADWMAGVRGVEASGLAVTGDRDRPDVVHAVIEPGGGSGDVRGLRQGEQVLAVLEGSLVLEVAGERYTVAAGETLRYPADRPHSWHNPNERPARAFWWLLHG